MGEALKGDADLIYLFEINMYLSLQESHLSKIGWNEYDNNEFLI